jgi:plasmid maintenance system antidote protein VapI
MAQTSIARRGTAAWKVHADQIQAPGQLPVNDIVLKRHGSNADTAIRLSRFLETTEQFSMNLEARMR